MSGFLSKFGQLLQKPGSKAAPTSALAMSLMIHGGIIVVGASITVAVINLNPPVMFEAKPTATVSARKLEHSIRVKQMQNQSRKPQIMQRLMSTAPGSVALPEMPKMAIPDQKNLRDTPMASNAGGLIGSLGGGGGGAGRGLTGGSGYSDTKFFGENVRTRSIVILLDASQTLINKNVLGDVVKETGTMLAGLAPVTKFNVIGFVDGAAAMFPQMVFATQANRSNALARLKTREGKGDANQWTEAGFVPNRVGNCEAPPLN